MKGDMFAGGGAMGAGSRYTSFQGGALIVLIIDGGPDSEPRPAEDEALGAARALHSFPSTSFLLIYLAPSFPPFFFFLPVLKGSSLKRGPEIKDRSQWERDCNDGAGGPERWRRNRRLASRSARRNGGEKQKMLAAVGRGC